MFSENETKITKTNSKESFKCKWGLHKISDEISSSYTKKKVDTQKVKVKGQWRVI